MKRRDIKKKILTLLLSVTMGLSLIPNYRRTVYADDSIITKEVNTVISKNSAITGFSTGHCIYFNAPATIKGGNEVKDGKVVKDSIPEAGGRAIITGSNDGTIMAFSVTGNKIWEAKAGSAMIFNVVAYDIDGDGLDEVLVPSADGNLYAFDDDGKLLWKFKGKDKMYTAAALKDSQGNVCIFTTGIDKYLYKLDPKGNLLNKTKYTTQRDGGLIEDNVITYMQTADLDGDGRETLIVLGTIVDMGTTSISSLDPDDLENPIWRSFFTGGTNLKKVKAKGHFDTADLDGDGMKEVILADQTNGSLFFLDSNGKEFEPFKKKNITAVPEGMPARGYRLNNVSYVDLPGQKPYILEQSAAHTAVYQIDANKKGVAVKDGNAYNGGTFDKETGLYFLNSEMSGGDEIHVIDLYNEKWSEDFTSMPEVGRITEIKENLSKLSEQIDNFKKPSYQTELKSRLTIIAEGGSINPEDYGIENKDNFNFMGYEWNWTEIFDRSHLPADFIIPGKVHNITTEDILAKAKKHEEDGTKFSIWTGHCTDPYYMQLSTLDKILELAPTTVQSFVFAEMDEEKDKVAISTMLIPLAELIKKHNSPAKIFMRDKFMFWNFDYTDPEWREFIDNYKDLVVPSLEETNCRTHELSLAGRVGLWKTETTDCWGGRLVEDNASVNKQFEWSMQQTPSNFVRNIVYQMANGADYFQNRITQLGNNLEYEDVYKLVDKGALIIPTTDQLVSVPDVAISFDNVDEEFKRRANNSHWYSLFDEDDDTKYVVNDIESWGGFAPIKDYDISKYIYGCTDRTPNFMPTTPYGVVACVPNYNTKEGELFKKVLKTDGKNFTIDGKVYDAESAKPVVEDILKDSRSRMPFYVEGNAAWSAVKIDDTHTRITLVDSNYMSPQGAKATIVSNTKDAVKCTDILSNEEISIDGNKMDVTVPAGVFRIIDVETKEKSEQGPVEPSKPINPVEPENPTEPETPVKPENPTKPEQPTQDTNPSDNIKPLEEDKDLPKTGGMPVGILILLSSAMLGTGIMIKNKKKIQGKA